MPKNFIGSVLIPQMKFERMCVMSPAISNRMRLLELSAPDPTRAFGFNAAA